MADGMRSHVHARHGRSVVTGSSSTPSHCEEPTSHGITFSRHDVLGASHTRKASPLLAGESTGSLPHRATQLPDKEFRSCLPWTCPSGRHSLRCRSLHVAMQMGPYHRPQAEGVWRMVSED